MTPSLAPVDRLSLSNPTLRRFNTTTDETYIRTRLSSLCHAFSAITCACTRMQDLRAETVKTSQHASQARHGSLTLDSKNPTEKRKAAVEGAAECNAPHVCTVLPDAYISCISRRVNRFDEDQAALVRLPSGFRTHPDGTSSSSSSSERGRWGLPIAPRGPCGSCATCLGRSDRTILIRLEYILMRRGT
jgi:hypothetical protein